MHNCLSRAAAREEKLWPDDYGLSQRLHANYSPHSLARALAMVSLNFS